MNRREDHDLSWGKTNVCTARKKSIGLENALKTGAERRHLPGQGRNTPSS